MKKQLKMLIADDQEISRILLRNFFETDYEIFEAENGIQVMELMRQGDIDILLLDILMPEMDGIAVLKQIKTDAVLSRIPVIVNTELDLPDKELEAFDLGADDFIRKPYNLQIIGRRVKNLVQKYVFERNGMIDEIENAETSFQVLMDTVPGGIATLYVSDKIQVEFYNESLAGLLGYTSQQLLDAVGEDFTSLVREEDINRFHNVFRMAAETNEVYNADICFCKADGSRIWLGLAVNHILMQGRKQQDYFCVAFSDRTQQRIAQKQMQDSMQRLLMKAEKDSVTGIYNRETFEEKVHWWILTNPETRFVLAILNIDRFKVINALYGSKAGDRALKMCAEQIASVIGTQGLYGRLEQDHFACFASKELLCEKLGEIERLLREGAQVEGIEYPVMMHVGFYEIEYPVKPVSSMYDMALLALREISGNYLKRWNYFSQDLRNKLEEEQTLVGEMELALRERQFFVHLQPVYDAQTAQIASAEALVRWKHPKRGIISPAVFIPLFEKNGFIMKLDHYVWDSVARLLAENKERGLENVPISVNVSRISFFNQNLVQDLEQLLKKYGLDHSLLKLEITESAYTENPYQLIDTLNQLRSNGFVILMDDFGSGYSSLNVLKDCPVDILKIDMKFLEHLEQSAKATKILYNVVNMAKSLQMPVIAEGVENKNQFDFLNGIGCEFIQGYYFSRPVDVDSFRQAVLDNRLELEGKAKEKAVVLNKTRQRIITPPGFKPEEHMTLEEFQMQMHSLRESHLMKQEFEDMLRSNIIGVARVKLDLYDTDLQGQIVFMNPYYLEIHGISREEQSSGQINLYHNLMKEDQIMTQKLLRKALDNREAILQNIYNIQGPDGKMISVLVSAGIMYEENDIAYLNVVEVPIWPENEELITKAMENVLVDLLSHTKLNIWRYDLVHDAFIYQSKSMENNGQPIYVENAHEMIIPQHSYLDEDLDRVRKMYQRIRDGEPVVKEIYHIHSSADPNQLIWVKIIYKTIYNYNKKPVMAIGIAENITTEMELTEAKKHEKETSKQLKSAEEQIDKLYSMTLQAQKDLMTGCMSRAFFEQIVSEHGKRHEQQLHAFLMIDVDNFKLVNDTFGHDVGDLVLKSIAEQLMRVLGLDNMVGRIGGDEFAALVVSAQTKEQVKSYADKICKSIYMNLEKGGEQVIVSCSVGISIAKPGHYDFASMYNRADQALYGAKANGKNQYIF